MEMEILFSKVVFFIAQKERPAEVPFWAYKKTILQKRLQCTAGSASKF
jgi:hypothetical protein